MPLRFYTTEQLGTVQSLTPEGFLLCENVPIARVGTMLYVEGEVPVEAGPDHMIRIHREPDEVFSPMAIASFNGKPVTFDHPPDRVTPDSYKVYSVGTTLNPRQGDGLLHDSSFLFADLLITEPRAIQAIRQKRRREVSAGYDAEYEQIQPGEGRQHLIVGNHVALVDRGRCGPRCSIGDALMPNNRQQISMDAIRARWARVRDLRRKTKDAVLVEELQKVEDMLGDILSGATDEGGFAGVTATESTSTSDDGGIHIHMHGAEAQDDDDLGSGVNPDAGGVNPIPGGAGEGSADPMQNAGEGDLEQRVAALERAVAILAQGEEDEGGDGDQAEGDIGGDDGSDAPDEGDRDNAMAGDNRRGKAASAKDAASAAAARLTASRASGKPAGGARAMVGDSTSLRMTWTETLSRAELIAPGIKVPTFDAAKPAKFSQDAMCMLRRKTLIEGMKEADTAAVIKAIANGKSPKVTEMTCDAVAMLFNGTSEAIRSANNSLIQGRTASSSDHYIRSGATVISDINARNREFYSKAH